MESQATRSRFRYGSGRHRKMWINNRGQMGPVGEDFLYYSFVLIIIGFILLLVISTFADYEARYFLLDGFRLGQAYADKAAVSLAAHYKTDESAKMYRVLDNQTVAEKLNGGECTDICQKCGVCVRDRRTGINRSCGQSLCANANIDPVSMASTVRLPVALKVNDKEFHPAVLEVTMILGGGGSTGGAQQASGPTHSSGSPASKSADRPDQQYIDAITEPGCIFVEDAANPYDAWPVSMDCVALCGIRGLCDPPIEDVRCHTMDDGRYWCGCNCK
jgi:hypothetical protein